MLAHSATNTDGIPNIVGHCALHKCSRLIASLASAATKGLRILFGVSEVEAAGGHAPVTRLRTLVIREGEYRARCLIVLPDLVVTGEHSTDNEWELTGVGANTEEGAETKWKCSGGVAIVLTMGRQTAGLRLPVEDCRTD